MMKVVGMICARATEYQRAGSVCSYAKTVGQRTDDLDAARREALKIPPISTHADAAIAFMSFASTYGANRSCCSTLATFRMICGPEISQATTMNPETMAPLCGR